MSGIDATELSADTVGELVVVHTGRLNGMARGARNGVVPRKTGVMIQFLTQLHLCRMHSN